MVIYAYVRLSWTCIYFKSNLRDLARIY
jgi:hypothetical protein